MRACLRLVGLLLLAGLVLQLYFAARIGLMRVLPPESTAFERSQAWRLQATPGALKWRQTWVPYARLPDTLKRAVIASEDASFAEHDGVDLEALEKAWSKNQQAEQQALNRATRAARAARQTQPSRNHHPAQTSPAKPAAPKPAAKPSPKIVGGSTITQQLAKNLFLSGERTLLRKGQELVLTLMLEAMLGKPRILEIYLNHVEWGSGIFGAEAAAQHYYRKPAAQLSPYEAARLAVMLPRPRYFETRPNSPYLAARANTIAARMQAVELP